MTSKSIGKHKNSKKSASSAYQRRIQRSQALHPNASRSQLRGHPKKNENPLSELRARPISKLSWEDLTPKEKDLRVRGTHAVAMMRRKRLSLEEASHREGISPEAVRKHTGAVRKVKGRWRPTAWDKIERDMRINEDGESSYLLVNDSRHARTVGSYFSAVGRALESGDERILSPFVGKRIRDSGGNYHTLETSLNTLYGISERREAEEFFEIYRR
jgi:hypothetical protein